MKTIRPEKDEQYLDEAVDKFLSATMATALTGAGISVASGIADFRSPGGVWTRFAPEEYATLNAFLSDPQKAWQLYRELGKTLVGKTPNKGHRALATLEREGHLKGLVTQNIDNLHQAAGNDKVLEIHGDHQHLQCLNCGNLLPVEQQHYSQTDVPTCNLCDAVLKPNVVLFGESVRHLDRIESLIGSSDLLLVIGTSAQIHPAAGLPSIVKQNGGLIYEFNLEPALSSSSYGTSSFSDFFFEGELSTTLPRFTEKILTAKSLL